MGTILRRPMHGQPAHRRPVRGLHLRRGEGAIARLAAQTIHHTGQRRQLIGRLAVHRYQQIGPIVPLGHGQGQILTRVRKVHYPGRLLPGVPGFGRVRAVRVHPPAGAVCKTGIVHAQDRSRVRPLGRARPRQHHPGQPGHGQQHAQSQGAPGRQPSIRPFCCVDTPFPVHGINGITQTPTQKIPQLTISPSQRTMHPNLPISQSPNLSPPHNQPMTLLQKAS